jgi:hypothetical protein
MILDVRQRDRLSREFPNIKPPPTRFNERRNNVFDDLILINEPKRFFGIVTNRVDLPTHEDASGRIERSNAMKNLLLAAAAATLVLGAAPAFASPADDAQWDITPQSPSLPCHFVREPVRMPNGHVAYEEVQVCR